MDVCDGKYVGPMTKAQVIEQLEYRIAIHETYAGLAQDNPKSYYARVYGSYEFHMWAINGYKEAIRHIKHITFVMGWVSKLLRRR